MIDKHEPTSKEQPGKGDIGRPKQVTIIVNAQKKVVDARSRLTFEQLVKLAFENPPTGANVGFTVSYDLPRKETQGDLYAGESIVAEEGMVFDVTLTDRS